MRQTFCEEMIKAFEERAVGKKFIFLTGDLGFKALEPLREVMGDHFLNAGIAEQNMISVAAGIAKTGLQVFVYSISPFIYARPFEHVRNDVCLHNLPVTLVGNGGGYGYGVMGATHHAIEDYGTLLSLQNMHAFVPVFDEDIAPMIANIFALNGPSYLRLGLAKKVNDIDKIAYASWRKVLHGESGTLLITGSIASDLLYDFQRESSNLRPNIWILSELPLHDNLPQNFIDDVLQTSKLCILEEHVAQGGVGQIIAAELLKKKNTPKFFTHLHAKGYVSGFYGSQDFHRRESGLTKSAITKFMQEPS